MKTLKDLCTGDVVKLADGPAINVEWQVISGPRKGEKGYYVGASYEEVDA